MRSRIGKNLLSFIYYYPQQSKVTGIPSASHVYFAFADRAGEFDGLIGIVGTTAVVSRSASFSDSSLTDELPDSKQNIFHNATCILWMFFVHSELLLVLNAWPNHGIIIASLLLDIFLRSFSSYFAS